MLSGGRSRQRLGAAALGATTLVLVASCDHKMAEATRGELGAADLPPAEGDGGWGGGSGGAPVAPRGFEGGGSDDDVPVAIVAGAPTVGGGGASARDDAGVATDDTEPTVVDEGESGTGGAPDVTCDRVADLVAPTCAAAGPPDIYRETGLGWLEVEGWNAYEEEWPAHSSATAINASGDVAGYATLCDRVRAVLYRDGALLELDPIPSAIHTLAWDVNDEGDVLGVADDVGFVWNNGVTTLLTGVGTGLTPAINNHGQVLGADDDGPYIWNAGVVQRLGLGRNVKVTNLNDRGQVTGYSESNDAGSVTASAFIWEDGVITPLPPLPGDEASAAWAINEAGQVVGSSTNRSGVARAVLWDAGVPFDITPPTDKPLENATGLDINENGVVVGQFQDEGRRNYAAFVFDDGVTTRFFPEDPTVGAAISPAAINEAGQIAGTTLLWNGSPHQATVWSRSCFGGCCD